MEISAQDARWNPVYGYPLSAVMCVCWASVLEHRCARVAVDAVRRCEQQVYDAIVILTCANVLTSLASSTVVALVVVRQVT